MSGVLREGWMQVTGYNWITITKSNGEAEGTRVVIGYVRALGESDLGVSLVRDSRWALAFYGSPEATTPFYIMPGCEVKGVQLFQEPVKPGFVTTNDPDQKWRYERVDR